MKFLKPKEKKRLIEELKEIYGVSELNYLLIKTGKEKIRGFSGHLSKEEIAQIRQEARVETIGMFLINIKDNDPRINFDAITLLRDQITKSKIEINKEQFELWMRGNDLDIRTRSGTLVIQHENNLIGIGKSNGKQIFNYLPKERKLKTPLPKV